MSRTREIARKPASSTTTARSSGALHPNPLAIARLPHYTSLRQNFGPEPYLNKKLAFFAAIAVLLPIFVHAHPRASAAASPATTVVQGPQAAAAQATSNAAWDALVEDFFNNTYFKYQPTAGTASGFHQYDAQ